MAFYLTILPFSFLEVFFHVCGVPKLLESIIKTKSLINVANIFSSSSLFMKRVKPMCNLSVRRREN